MWLCMPRKYDDWTGNVVPEATVRSLDPSAVRALRATYGSLHGDSDDTVSMDDGEFLSRVGLFKRGKVTNAAMVLLGKSSEPISSSSVCIRWRLIGIDGSEEDSRILERPLLLATRQVVSMVRNSSVKIGSGGRVTSTYRVASLTEAIFNAIQFQDYESGGTIDVVERERESVTVSNTGTFPPIRPEAFALSRPTNSDDRNMFLRRAMVTCGLVPGTVSGIRGMYLSQAYRHFPLPDFSTVDGKVSITFPGIRSGPYARILDTRDDLSFETIMDIDRMSKGRYVPERRMAELVSQGLVAVFDGVPALICDDCGVMRRYRGTDREAVLALISDVGPVSRSDVVEMLRARGSHELSDSQISVKATNLLQSMRKEGLVEKVEGSTRSARYRAVER